MVEKLGRLPNWSAYDAAISRILDSKNPDLRVLKPRELNFTNSLMRQSYAVFPVGRNSTGTSGIISVRFAVRRLAHDCVGIISFKYPC